MATEVHVFLPPPADPTVLLEAHPFGPGGSGFRTGLDVDVDANVADQLPALAAVSGRVGAVPDPTPPTGGTATCSLMLLPGIGPAQDLTAVAGRSALVLVYRNLDLASVLAVMRPRVQAAADELPFPGRTIDERVGLFGLGSFRIEVDGGDELGTAAPGPAPGWARLDFEIAYVPSGLDGTKARARLKELVEPSSIRTRRLDPAAFYGRVASGGAASVALTAAHAAHPLFAKLTRRVLLEVRDEYDLPYEGPVLVGVGSAAPATMSAPAGGRGVLELAAAAPGAPPETVTVSVSVDRCVLTDLPSGNAAALTRGATRVTPDQLSVQRIVMSDLPHPTDPTDPDSWFGPGTTDPSRGITLARFTTGNKVTPLIDGEETFRQMVAELRKVGVTGTGAGPVARGDFIRLAGWWLTDSFPLVGKDPTSTFHSLASAARAAGVPVNALLWDQAFSSQNDAEVANINAMGGRAVLDADHIIAGAHHQKMLIVNGAGGALAFCGGIDINPDRSVGNAHEIPDKFHDVHAKVEGPAVADINFTFLQRWNNHPTSATGAALPVTSPPYASRPGSHFVHVSRTFPPRYRYPFLPVGEDLGTLRAVLRAIGRAQRFIYLEDQYAMPYAGLLPNSANADGLGIRDALRAALSRPGFEYLIIVTALDADLWQAPFRRHTFITGLKNEFPGRVHAFYLRKPGAHNIYVHSKAWIIDDVYVKIGSANCTRRGFTNETELDIHVIDEALESGTRRMARDFRLRLWAEHLGVGARPAVLADPTHALSYWLTPEKGSHIAPYDDTDVGTLSDQSQWDTVLDPDGR